MSYLYLYLKVIFLLFIMSKSNSILFKKLILLEIFVQIIKKLLKKNKKRYKID